MKNIAIANIVNNSNVVDNSNISENSDKFNANDDTDTNLSFVDSDQFVNIQISTSKSKKAIAPKLALPRQNMYNNDVDAKFCIFNKTKINLQSKSFVNIIEYAGLKPSTIINVLQIMSKSYKNINNVISNTYKSVEIIKTQIENNVTVTDEISKLYDILKNIITEINNISSVFHKKKIISWIVQNIGDYIAYKYISDLFDSNLYSNMQYSSNKDIVVEHGCLACNYMSTNLSKFTPDNCSYCQSCFVVNKNNLTLEMLNQYNEELFNEYLFVPNLYKSSKHFENLENMNEFLDCLKVLKTFIVQSDGTFFLNHYNKCDYSLLMTKKIKIYSITNKQTEIDINFYNMIINDLNLKIELSCNSINKQNIDLLDELYNAALNVIDNLQIETKSHLDIKLNSKYKNNYYACIVMRLANFMSNYQMPTHYNQYNKENNIINNFCFPLINNFTGMFASNFNVAYANKLYGENLNKAIDYIRCNENIDIMNYYFR